MTKLTQRYPPTPYPFAKGQNLEIGLAELMQQSAGMGATLEGHINGAGVVAGVANPAPLNPSGDYGHDHSGGEYGRALFRSVCTFTLDDGATFNTAPILGGAKPGNVTVPDAADGTTNAGARVRLFGWVPPCDPVNGAYVSLGVAAVVYTGTTTLSADVSSPLISGDVATFRIWRRNPLSLGQIVSELSIGTPHVAGGKLAESGASTKLQVQPGAFNEFVCEVEVARTTGGATRGLEAYLLEFELGVYSS